ncbi:DUF2512 family protein [Heyndrickxia ginsengihumi]|uniref:DUF2512 family protein n=1 Tax=Heyndrickxia ginsengihumi TaxID=363870 RepID=A0A6M0P4Y5_9BACI|nr:DUF2512 family protein [Heyndrickxia ginsengihumi]MCM3021828.1 YndM family protein [Heyndrickxia ginsengihumi]NEY19762.1 DUF2512 family protein [Heyndrickxia ginsengihumi]
MENSKPLAIKLIGNLLILFLTLGIVFDMPFYSIMLITLTFGLISYFLIDIGMLPNINQWFTFICDLGLAFSIIWGLTSFFPHNHLSSLYISMLSAVTISFFEYYFHQYFAAAFTNTNIVTDRHSRRSLQYQFETSEEIDPTIHMKDEEDV